jgi:hypothetical protein
VVQGDEPVLHWVEPTAPAAAVTACADLTWRRHLVNR